MNLRVSFSLGFRCVQHNAGMQCLLASVKCCWVWSVDEDTHVICVGLGRVGEHGNLWQVGDGWRGATPLVA